MRLPPEFRFPRERVRRVHDSLLLEPVVGDLAAWFAAMDELDGEPFMPEAREQPPMSERGHRLRVTYLLDSSTCDALIESRPIGARRMLAAALAANAVVTIPAKALFELWFGAARSAPSHRLVNEARASGKGRVFARRPQP